MIHPSMWGEWLKDIPEMIREYILNVLLLKHTLAREPDIYIGGRDNVYLKRWYVIPRNKLFNIYFHQFVRSDDDRALHDHPWWNASWILCGSYNEIVADVPKGVEPKRGTPTKTLLRKEGFIGFRLGKSAHRIQLHRDPEDGHELGVYTLFFTGPRFRKWGFWCPHSWRFWEDFNGGKDKPDESVTGRGCE